MKKCLIITPLVGANYLNKEKAQKMLDFIGLANDKQSQWKVSGVAFCDLIFHVENSNPSIHNTIDDADLSLYDLVYIKDWRGSMDQATTIARYLESHNIKFINGELLSFPCLGKLSQMFAFAMAGLPVPNTLFVPFKNVSLAVESMAGNSFTYPMIVKANVASMGEKNFLVNNETELQTVFENNPEVDFVIQNFIPNDGDYRLLYMGLDRMPLIFKRVASQESGHLNNTSAGGSGELLDSSIFSETVLQQAKEAARIMGRQVGGVDLMINSSNGHHVFLEVNATPSVATGFADAEKIEHFVEFLQSLAVADTEITEA